MPAFSLINYEDGTESKSSGCGSIYQKLQGNLYCAIVLDNVSNTRDLHNDREKRLSISVEARVC